MTPWWQLWVADPLALAALAGAAGLVRARRRAGGVADPGRDRWLLAGALIAALALVSPVAGLSGDLLAAHMVQHVLLLFVAAPVLALGDPGPAVLAALPRRRRRVLSAWRRAPALLHRPGGGVAAAAVASAAALWLWHAPPLYDAAVRLPVLHVLEHTTLLVPAVALWGAVVRRRTRHRQLFLVTVLASALLVMQGGVLAAILVFVPEPLYAVHDTAPWGLGALEDQRLAGVLLWVVGGPAYALVAVIAMVRGLHATERWAPSVPGRAGQPRVGDAPGPGTGA